MANVPTAGIGGSSSAGAGRPPSLPAGAGSGIGAGAEATGSIDGFAPNVLTGWNRLMGELGRGLPAALQHSDNLVAAARRHLARIR